MSKTRRQPTPAALAAKAIRTELKTAFPHTTFSVRSENFSGGDAVNIEWTDGPTTDQVETLTGKYEYGHFDGMIDLYEYSNVRSDIPQAKYVQTQRTKSNETVRAIVEYLNRVWGYVLRFDEGTGWIDPLSDPHTGNGWQSMDIHKHFHRTSLICRECGTPRQFSDAYCAECGAKVAEPMA